MAAEHVVIGAVGKGVRAGGRAGCIESARALQSTNEKFERRNSRQPATLYKPTVATTWYYTVPGSYRSTTRTVWYGYHVLTEDSFAGLKTG